MRRSGTMQTPRSPKSAGCCTVAVMHLTTEEGRRNLAAVYRRTLLEDVMPFWDRHGLDRTHGGVFTALDRDGTVIDTDKSVWFQGRAGWMWATLHSERGPNAEWLAAAQSCVDFAERCCHRADGKMYFSVTEDGRPLRMRRYVYSECFSAVAHAALARATGGEVHATAAVRDFGAYLRHSFEPGVMPAKFEPTRPAKGIGPLMMTIATAQELRSCLGDEVVGGRSCTEWIEGCAGEIERDFFKPDLDVLMETVAPDGGIIDHFDGRTLNPGHAIECAWFLLREGAERNVGRFTRLGLAILDAMWARGWDEEFGGLFYFRDLNGRPVQEYWHDMKFWWPHCEAIIATLMAWQVTGDERYARWHAMVHDWSFARFPDPQFGEWFGYLHRDGRVSVPLKGNMWKGPFHLPRMLHVCARLLGA